MNRTALPIAAAALACALNAAPANAASNRTFVSGLGDDGNACTLALPCRTLQAAFNVTASDGEIDVLDPTGYGALTITHGVSIRGHGWASLNAAAGASVITVNASPGDRIILRGLVIEGFGTGQAGILFTGGGTLVVEDSTIHKFAGSGIAFKPNAPGGLTVANTTVAENALNGILVRPSGAATYRVMFRKVEAYDNLVSGITVDDAQMTAATGQIEVTASDCTVSVGVDTGSTSTAFLAMQSTNSVNVAINNSVAHGYARGISAIGLEALVSVSRSVFEQIATPSFTNNGVVLSYGDNYTGQRQIGTHLSMTD
jgi:hypothetical protein